MILTLKKTMERMINERLTVPRRYLGSPTLSFYSGSRKTRITLTNWLNWKRLAEGDLSQKQNMWCRCVTLKGLWHSMEVKNYERFTYLKLDIGEDSQISLRTYLIIGFFASEWPQPYLTYLGRNKVPNRELYYLSPHFDGKK